MKFLSLPDDLLLSVADVLPIGDLSSLILAYPQLTRILTPHFENHLRQIPDGITPLHWAAEHGHASLAEIAISRGAKTYRMGKLNRTPLHLAAYYNHTAVIRLLLKHGRCTTMSDNNFKTSLDLAVSQGAVEATRALLELGAGIGDAMVSPAHRAARRGDIDCLKAFIDAGFKLRARDHEGRTILHHAISSSGADIDILEYLLTQEGAKMAINVQCRRGETPLHVAAGGVRAEYIRLLLRHGADMRIWNYSGFNPAQTAVRMQNVACVRAFIDAGFEVSTKGGGGRTLLHQAALDGVTMLGYVLGLEGSEVVLNNPDSYGNTPLHLAAGRSADSIKLLLQHGADMGLKNKDRNTPAHTAASSGSVRCIRPFIDAGFDVNTKNRWGRTILHNAAIMNSADMVEYLLSACFTRNPYGPLSYKPTIRERLGANFLPDSFRRFGQSRSKCHVIAARATRTDDRPQPLAVHNSANDPSKKPPSQRTGRLLINARDLGGSTPLHHAARRTQKAVVVMRLLEGYGADPMMEDRKSKTPAEIYHGDL